jgi:hypothetical protein
MSASASPATTEASASPSSRSSRATSAERSHSPSGKSHGGMTPASSPPSRFAH